MKNNPGWDDVPKRRQRLYSIWVSMRTRCHRPYSPAYKYYGGIGVTICPEWEDYEAFRAWSRQSGYDPFAPRGECTLDRINPFGNYEPSNCRWATVEQQNRNQRDAKATDWGKIITEYTTTQISLKALAVKYGASKSTIVKRAAKEKWARMRNDQESEAEHAE